MTPLTGVSVKNGEHRRNVVTRGTSLKALRRGERFRVGEVASSTGGRARSDVPGAIDSTFSEVRAIRGHERRGRGLDTPASLRMTADV